MKKITKTLFNWLPAITLGIVLGSFLQLTQAWQEPGSNPPNSNIGAPVTTGSANQYKTGALAVEGILRGWNTIQTMDEFCFGSDCRSDWQDLYKSGDNVCIESGGCVDVTDNYIGDSGTHYAGGTLNMSGSDITNVDDVRLNDIYKDGWGEIDIYDDVNMKGNRITGVEDPIYGSDAVNKDYVDDKAADVGDVCKSYNLGGHESYDPPASKCPSGYNRVFAHFGRCDDDWNKYKINGSMYCNGWFELCCR